ncbi:DUF6716 putative glycosyltransferase [Streptomyces sudanensis]|uniref:DUF6716 putative glycosyltransferase n=1 Tax=Streptomyces sudanensis TaxID=436397 RepID=UPI0020CEF591|nr:DUF6716 putative glycosyltransferase [Streptomyces sudanensis]MCP9957610.1 hypothetical protein [Streptomyces sudanensis]MCQ0001848.1 hypothetical protein [Streptomyces sudanensis]
MPFPIPRIAVLADSDTRWKWGALTARRIAPPPPPGATDPDVTGYVLRGRATPTARQLAEAGLGTPREVTGAEFLRAVRDEAYDVVVLALVGGSVQALLHGLAGAGPGRRPVVVTGYVGVVYEKLADGLLLRHGADVVLANSPYDARRFRAVYEGVGADPSAVVEAALPFLGGAPHRPVPGRHTVVFAAQPSVPASRADRLYLLRRLAGHARLHPGREVLLKLRSKPGEHTTHIEELPYQKLARTLPLPPNLRLVYGHMGDVLDRTDLLVTVSSTAALESLHRGVPTAVLTDLGVREALGNHYFVGSGLLTSWDRLDAGDEPVPDPAWLADQGAAPAGDAGRDVDAAFAEARRRVADLLARDTLPPIAPYYTAASAPGYLPGILARHRLDTDAPAAAERGVRRVLRDAARGAARGAYRHGVQHVAPLIRRLGEL